MIHGRRYHNLGASVCVATILLLIPDRAHADNLDGLLFLALVILVGLVLTVVPVGLSIASAVIGRRNAPNKKWKRHYGWTAVSISAIAVLYHVIMAGISFVSLVREVADSHTFYRSTYLFFLPFVVLPIALTSLLLAIRVLRNCPKVGLREMR